MESKKMDVTAIKLKLYCYIIVFSIYTMLGYSQIRNYYLKPAESINIAKLGDQKISVYIFLKKGDTSEIAQNLNQTLDNITLDYQNFNFYRIYTDPQQACAKDKRIYLDSVEFLSYPSFDDYLILLNAKNKKFNELLKKKLGEVNFKEIVSDFKNIDYTVTFKKVINESAFIKLITLPLDTNSYIKSQIYYDLLDRLEKQRLKDIQHYDSIIKKVEAKFTKNSFLSIEISPFFINRSYIKHLRQYNTKLDNLNLNTFQLKFIQFQNKKYKNIGYTLGVSYSKLVGNISIGNNFQLKDTVDKKAFDSNSIRFVKIATGKKINEKFEISSASISTSFCFKRSLKIDNTNGFVIINQGLKFSNIILSNYYATIGTISFDSLYPQYSMFIKKGNEESVYLGKRQLNLNNRFFSGFVSVNFYLNTNKDKFYYNIGTYIEIGNNIQTRHNSEESLLPNSIDYYNSLFYKSDYFKLNSFGLNIGICYKL